MYTSKEAIKKLFYSLYSVPTVGTHHGDRTGRLAAATRLIIRRATRSVVRECLFKLIIEKSSVGRIPGDLRLTCSSGGGGGFAVLCRVKVKLVIVLKISEIIRPNTIPPSPPLGPRRPCLRRQTLHLHCPTSRRCARRLFA